MGKKQSATESATRKIIIPKGTINPDQTCVIEIPKYLDDEETLIAFDENQSCICAEEESEEEEEEEEEEGCCCDEPEPEPEPEPDCLCESESESESEDDCQCEPEPEPEEEECPCGCGEEEEEEEETSSESCGCGDAAAYQQQYTAQSMANYSNFSPAMNSTRAGYGTRSPSPPAQQLNYNIGAPQYAAAPRRSPYQTPPPFGPQGYQSYTSSPQRFSMTPSPVAMRIPDTYSDQSDCYC